MLNYMASLTREEWLEKAVESLRPYFIKNKLELPPVQVSCGFPSKGGLSKNNRTMGECWNGECTNNGTRHIFITPLLGSEKAAEVIGWLIHELLHAALPDDAKHGPKFKDGMKALGLEGNAKNAFPGPELLLYVERIADDLVSNYGEYQNVALKPKEKTKKEKATAKKSFKLHCPKKRAGIGCVLVDKTTGGDYTATSSRKMLKLGFPLCVCGAEMEMEEEDFELYRLGDTA